MATGTPLSQYLVASVSTWNRLTRHLLTEPLPRILEVSSGNLRHTLVRLRCLPTPTAVGPTLHCRILTCFVAATDQRVPGYVTGYVRRFWQVCRQHDSTPTDVH